MYAGALPLVAVLTLCTTAHVSLVVAGYDEGSSSSISGPSISITSPDIPTGFRTKVWVSYSARQELTHLHDVTDESVQRLVEALPQPPGAASSVHPTAPIGIGPGALQKHTNMLVRVYVDNSLYDWVVPALQEQIAALRPNDDITLALAGMNDVLLLAGDQNKRVPLWWVCGGIRTERDMQEVGAWAKAPKFEKSKTYLADYMKKNGKCQPAQRQCVCAHLTPCADHMSLVLLQNDDALTNGENKQPIPIAGRHIPADGWDAKVWLGWRIDKNPKFQLSRLDGLTIPSIETLLDALPAVADIQPLTGPKTFNFDY